MRISLFKLLVVTGCFFIAGMAHAQRMTEVVVECDTMGAVNYGTEIIFKFYWLNKKGKKKEFDDSDIKKDFTLTAVNATWVPYPTRFINNANGTQTPVYGNYMALRITNRPGSQKINSVSYSITYNNEKGPVYTVSRTIKFNYQGSLELNFCGRDGKNGSSGVDKGAPLIFRDGKDGGDGSNGENGENGHVLNIRIKRITDSLTGQLIGRIDVMDETTNELHRFYTTKPENGFYVNVSGGKGGNGGNGGDGGRGKHAKSEDGKITDPGNGGKGGNGGAGGNGGNGGRVNVVLHTNAGDLLNGIIVVNLGGSAGWGGSAGNGGKPGDSIQGSGSGTTGAMGNSGSYGTTGNDGQQKLVVIEDF